MLRARRAFLQRGHFAPFSDAINALVAGYLAASASLHEAQPAEPVAILDVGCGEGYYLGRLQLHLRQQLDRPITYHGVDIAKEAVRLAARSYPELHVAVADVTTRMPYADGSFHVLLNVFAPRNPREFARLIAPGGLLVVAIPRPNHLRELRAVVPLLDIEEDKQRRVAARLEGLFTCVGASTVEYDIELDGKDLTHLVQMTPSARHLPPQALDSLRGLTPFHTRARFTVLRFSRA